MVIFRIFLIIEKKLIYYFLIVIYNLNIIHYIVELKIVDRIYFIKIKNDCKKL